MIFPPHGLNIEWRLAQLRPVIVLALDRFDAEWIPRDAIVFVGGKLSPDPARDLDEASNAAIIATMVRDVGEDVRRAAEAHDAKVRAREREDRQRRGELSNADRAARWLAHAEPATSGRCGKGAACASHNARWFAVAASVGRGFDLGFDDAHKLLVEWNRTCSPPLPPKAVERKVREALARGRVAIGAPLDRRAA